MKSEKCGVLGASGVARASSLPCRSSRLGAFVATAVRPHSAFTLVEMLVVIGIIALVAAMSIPMITPFTRTRKLDQAAEVVKSACLLARSKAVRERRMFSVTLLEAERQIFITDYEMLRDTIYDSDDPPVTPHDKPLGDPQKPYCAHYLDNYLDSSATNEAKYVARAAALEYFSEQIGERVRTLPEGCTFNLDGNKNASGDDITNDYIGWTWVFLPNGSVWTLRPGAENERGGSDWLLTTYMSGGKPAGPVIFGPQGQTSATIVVYAMSGQVVSE